ncbi:3-oxoacyl-ACP reductase, partial [Candidatus Saccharibacteria bacterium]|nr:3-oxoacyl-ACP reductase [Candidatus Saccharibacteria bacterium]NIV71669.1 3-oxoacyl-ACP reductase [Calditrichia bacterium]NIW78607.1 3-oxoacyl-ACP reductase [Calditrichia bacterium]
INQIKSLGREAIFYNVNAADEEKRKEVVADIRERIPKDAYLKVMMHSLAFGSLKAFIDQEPSKAITRANINMTMEVMAHTLVYWSQELYWKDLLGHG